MRSNIGKQIALSGIASAMAIIAITLSVFINPMTVTFNVLAAIFIMMPLTKGYWKGAIMAYISTAIIVFFIGNIKTLPFITFFGIYAIVQWALDFAFLKVKKLPVWLIYVISWIIKIAYFQLVIFLMWTFMNVILIEMNFFGLEITYWLVTLIGNVFFVVYDIFMHMLYIQFKRFVDKRIK